MAAIGPNGSGKTALLEAVAVLGNLTSFRTGAPGEWIQRGSAGFELTGEIATGGTRTTLRQSLDARSGSGRQLQRGGRRIGSSEYLRTLPVFAFSSQDIQLLAGPPQVRRRFLDRLAFHLHPETLDIIQRYRRAFHQRNALLRRESSDEQLDAFEHDLAFLGARISVLRRAALGEVQMSLESELERFGWSLSRPVLRYNAVDGAGGSDVSTLATSLRSLLQRGRRRERLAGMTLVGPHRHDMEVSIHGSPARGTLSAGQGKVLVIALKLAALNVVSRVRGEVPAVVFDDVDAELDGGVLLRLLARLGTCPQVLISSAHEEMVVPRLPDATLWRLDTGAVHGASCERSGS